MSNKRNPQRCQNRGKMAETVEVRSHTPTSVVWRRGAAVFRKTRPSGRASGTHPSLVATAQSPKDLEEAAALDSVSLIDPSRDEQMQKALDWLGDHQEADGSWRASYAKGKRVDNAKTRETGLWVSLAICRIFTRLYE
jgi:hypothetical protein